MLPQSIIVILIVVVVVVVVFVVVGVPLDQVSAVEINLSYGWMHNRSLVHSGLKVAAFIPYFPQDGHVQAMRIMRAFWCW